MTSPSKMFGALYVHVARTACQQFMKQRKSFSFSFYPFFSALPVAQKGYVILYEAVAIAVIAEALKTPTWSCEIFQPRR